MVCREQLIEDIVNSIDLRFKDKRANRIEHFLQGRHRTKFAKLEEKQHTLFRKELHRYAEEIVPNYNRLIYSISAEVFSVLFNPLMRNVVVEEKQPGIVHKIKRLTEHCSVVFLPLHWSNLDSFILGFEAYKLGMKIPVFVAGVNLNKGISKSLIHSYNGSFIDRDFIQKDMVYAMLYLTFIDKIVEYKTPFLYFMQGGRSYNGELGYNLQTGIFKELIRIKRKNPDKKIALIGISTSYSFVPEAQRLYNSFLSGESAKQANLVLEWFRAVRTFKGNLPVYVVVHEPKMLEDYLGENTDLDDRELARKIICELGAEMKVLPLPLYAYSLVSKRGFENVRNELEENEANLFEELRSENTKNLSLIVRKYSREIEKVLVDDNVTRYYANTIKHLFKC